MGAVKIYIVSPLTKIFKEILKNPLTKPQKCGIIIVSRGEGNNPQGWREWIAEVKTAHYNSPPKIFSKTFEKPLDKYHKVWYNIYTR